MGEDIANELVEWFNAVDATYRADLTRLNEVNFQRFDATLEQRLTQFNARLEQRLAEFNVKLENRLVQFDAKLESRLGVLDTKLEQRLAQLDAKLERRFSDVKADVMRLEERMDRRFDSTLQQHRTALAELRAELIKWMFLFWVTTLGTLVALLTLWP